jgi:hypothetical protein
MKCHSTQVAEKSRQVTSGLRFMGLQVLSFAFLMIFAVSCAWSAESVLSPASSAKVLVLTPVSRKHLEQHKDEVRVKIMNGEWANPDDYPVSFQLATDQGTCTWFLIGARTMMTVAHCVSDGAKISIKKSDQTPTYEGQCTQAPGYSDDKSQDWALCLLSTDYQLSVGLFTGYEVINIDSSRLKIGKRIQITGFGCDREDGPLDNIYRVGWANITGLPPTVHLPDVLERTPNVFKIKKQPSQLCGGDSGGPAFEIVGESPLYRRVIGINSQTISTLGLGVGYLASTSTRDALGFFNKWAKDHNQKICGLHKDAKNCRPTGP